MILTDRQIKEAVEQGEISIKPFDERQLKAATYDLRVGDQGATTSGKRKIDVKGEGYLALEPGDFGVVKVLEEIDLGKQYAARCGLRSKYARKGLIATTGLQIDPGYRGRLTIGLTNLTSRPVSLPHMDDLVSVEFHRLEEPVTKAYDGFDQDKLELGGEEFDFITESEGMALSEILTRLRSLSEDIAQLTAEVKSITAEVKSITGEVKSIKGEIKGIKWTVPIIVAIGMSIIGIIVTIK